MPHLVNNVVVIAGGRRLPTLLTDADLVMLLRSRRRISLCAAVVGVLSNLLDPHQDCLWVIYLS